MSILCPYTKKCHILNKNPPHSREYKLRVRETCGSFVYVTCPMYINLDEQRKKTEHSSENLKKLEAHLGSLLGDEGLENDL